MKQELVELKKYTDEMLNGFSIDVMNGEKELLEKIDELFEVSWININYAKKVVYEVEEYLKAKEKMLIKLKIVKRNF